MKNRIVGFLIIGIAILIGFIIYSFNRAMVTIVSQSCSHGSTCPMWGSIDFQTNVSAVIMVFVVIIGIYLIFFGKEEKIITKIEKVHEQLDPKNITKENYNDILESLNEEESAVFEKIIESKGSVLQSKLIDDEFTKVRITRILDRLEGRNLIERKRRGMTNIVLLKHSGN
ncbi:MAG: hypothetical protein ISS36_00875 [Candidatus Aenigmarchaeota archaeon]|nr:hypothetical protein [Candidatus Aenigmarchaeota archaeon]